MRIMAADLSDVTVYRAEAKPSEYIGTKTEYVKNGTIRAQIQPVTDKIAVSLYGNRVEQMKNLMASKIFMLPVKNRKFQCIDHSADCINDSAC